MSSTGTQSQQQPAVTGEQPAGESAASHGSTGEGSDSAMARLISQEQARRALPGSPQDDGSS